jgi:GNAT superfamily N-acetyltransferase
MSALTVRPVVTSRDEKTFIRFQWQMNEDNPVWVPPLLLDRRKLIDRAHNPFYKHATMELFLAERDGRVVGRIGAIVNDNHIREHNEKVGFFGFFECIDDVDVARALLDRAAAWLRERGMEAMRGPLTPSVNDENGLLVEGFDKPPAILMPYNPPYYAALLEAYGLTKIKDMFAYYLHGDRVFSDKLVRMSELITKRTGVVFRTLDMKHFDREVAMLREIYNRGWEKNWGEVPLTEEEWKYVAKDLKPIVNPAVVIIAELKGKTIGFSLSLPDYNVVLRANRKGYLLPGLLRVLLFKKKINFMRVVILGVLPEYAATGIGGVLFYETGRRGVAAGLFHGEASWVLEDNVMMTRGAQLMQGEPYKRYRVYQKPL